MPRISGDSLSEHRSTVRYRILNAVRRLAVSRGADKVSLTDVAAEAGLNRSVVYNYFPDKASLLIAYAENETHRFLAELSEAAAWVR